MSTQAAARIAAVKPDQGKHSIDDWLAWREDEKPRVQTLLGLRKYWMNALYARLRAEYDASGADASNVMESPASGWFFWLDRYVQRQLWIEIARMVDARMPGIADAIAPRPGDLGRLELKPDMAYPDYYDSFDFHLQDGGIWRDDRGALIYALGSRVIHVGKNDKFELHDRFADAIPEVAVKRVLDLGCGFGKTTFSLARRYPDAEVVGIDLSAPCLRLARRMATERGLAITWKQGDCAALDEADGSCDLVTLTMTLHELPLAAIEATFAESRRVLRPGGLIVALENRYVGESLRDTLIALHSENIGEPHSRIFRSLDLAALATKHGFSQAKAANWYPFGGDDESARDPRRWTTPWNLLIARKPS